MKKYTGTIKAQRLAIPLACLIFLFAFSYRATALVTINGPTSVCAGAGVNAYSAVGGSFNYVWTVTSTGTTPIVVSGNTPVITIDWGSVPGTGTVMVQTGSGSASITVLIGVATPAISGVFRVCTSSVYPYSVVLPIAGEDYDWVVSGGAPPVWSGTSGVITWPGTPGTYTISLQASRPGEGSVVCYSAPFIQNVTVLSPPISGSITGGQDNICSGSSSVFNAPAPPPGSAYYNYTWTVTGSAPNVVSFTGQGTSAITVTGGTVAGTAAITVSYSNVLNGNCTATSITRNINIVIGPAPSITGSLLVCPGSGISYSATGLPGSTFSWSVSPVSGTWYGTIYGTSTGTPVTINWTNTTNQAQTGVVTLIESNSSGCTGSTSSNVTINPLPTVTAISDQIYCNGVPAPAIPLTGPVTGTTFAWTNSNPAIGLAASGSGSSIPAFTATNASALPITALITITPSANGCVGQISSYTITVYPTLIAGTAVSNQLICSQAIPTALTATSPTGGSAPYAYQWEYSTNNITFIPINGATAMTYQPGALSVDTWYKQAQTSAGNCGTVYTNAVKITVNSLPVPVITGAATACVNTSGNIYTTEAGMTGYTWSVAGGTIVGVTNTNAISVTWNVAGNQLITVNYTNGNGCTAATPATKIVTVQATIIPSITGPDPSCTGNTVIYTTESSMSNYIWTVSPGNTIVGPTNTNSIAVTWNSAGSQYVTVKYSDLNGCATSAPTVKNILVNASPALTITGTASICPNSSGVVYFTESGMTNYIWTITSGGSITAGQGTNAITVTWLTSGTQTITVNCTNASGCSAGIPSSKTILVLPTPHPVVSGPASACTGVTVYYNTEAGMTNYQWTLTSGGTIVSGNGTNSISVKWSVAGSHSVSVGYINSSGCPTITPTVKTVLVNTTPLANITGVDTVCLNGTTGYTTDPGNALYQWTVGSGGIITSGQGTNSILVKWTEAGTKLVTITYMTTNVCASMAEKSITVYPEPLPVISGPVFACAGGPGSEFSTETGMTNYTWSVSTGGTIVAGSGTKSVTVSWTGTGLQTVYVSYTDLHGCTSTTPSEYDISVNERPANPVITGLSTACAGTVNNTYSTVMGMGSYLWTVSTGGTILTNPSTNESTIVVAWNTAGAQAVGVNYINIAGCQALVPASHPVLVYTQPSPTLGGPDTVCLNSAGNVYTTESGKSNYIWTVSAGGTITSGGTSTSNTATISWTTAGTKTVKVNYANTSGCLAAIPATHTVTVNSLPAPVISGPATVCPGVPGIVYSTEPGMTNYNWTISSGGTITSGQGSGEITVTWALAGVQTVTVSYAELHGCTNAVPASKTVNVLPAPIPLLAGSALVCNGSTEVYVTDPGMSAYLWTVSPGGTIISGSNTNAVTINWTTPGQKTVTVAYTNSSGCISLTPTVKGVTVKTNVIATITGPDPSCTGHTVQYSTESGMIAYIWSVSAGGAIIGASNTNSVTITWNTPGNKTLSVIYTDPIGCTQTSPTVKPVAVNTSPAPTITGTSSICPGSSGIVYFTEPGMTGYTWSVSPGGMITGGNGTNAITVTWLLSGTQSVTVNYTNAGGCTASLPGSKIITVLPSPVPVITGPETICNGNNAVYSTETGMTDYQWTLSSGGTIISGNNTNAITISWSVVGSHSITVGYINSAGCPTMIPSVKNVLVNPTPAPTITGADSTCLNGTITFTTEAGQALYQWTVSSGGIITSGAGTSSISVKWTLAGTKTVTVNYTNTSNCTPAQPAAKGITVFSPPVPVISGPTFSCSGTTGVEYATAAGMNNYSWSISPGGTITSGAGTNSITVTWNTTGLQSVSVNYTDFRGCPAASATQYPVTVNSRPTPTVTGTEIACAGSANNTYTTQVGMNSYTWSVSSGGTIITNPSTHESTITVAWNTPGVQTVSVNYMNTAGCEAIAPVPFNCTVNAMPNPSITGPGAVCVNSTGNIYTTESGMNNYAWTVSPGGTITAGGTSGNNNVTVTWTTAGINTVKVNYANAFGCLAAEAKVYTVTVNQLPAPVITGPAIGCVNTSGNVYSTESGMTGYNWTISSGGTITSGPGTATITVSWNMAGTQSITVNYTNASGCTAVTPAEKTISILPLPVPVISGDADGCLSYNSTYTTETGMTNYFWTVSSGGTIISGINSPTVIINWIAPGPQAVTVSYTNQNGCNALPFVKPVTVHDYVLPAISGPAQSCTETPVEYATEAGMTNYTWTVSTSGVIIDGSGTQTITVIWYSPGEHTVTVNYVNESGCTAVVPGSKIVTLSTAPVPWINGEVMVCQGSTGNIYSTDAGMQNYEWSVSPGGLITSGAGTGIITVTWNLPGLQSVMVNYTDPAGCAAANPTTKEVTVSPSPVPTITGPAILCKGSSVVYFTEMGMSGYQWSISPGGLITSGINDYVITVDWVAAGSQSVTVIYTSANGCITLSPSRLDVTVNTLPVPTISNDPAICIDGTTTFNTEPGMSSYQWTVSSGGTIIEGAGTNSILVSWSALGVQTVTLSYVDANGCYPLQLAIKSVEVMDLPVPTINGPGLACIGATGNTYYTEAGMSDYNWTVTSGGIITAGAGTNSVTVTWNILLPQIITVDYTNPAGCNAATPAQYGITINPLPVPTLTGTSQACAGSVNNVYTTNPGMTNYQWSVSAGGTILTNPSTNASTITVAWNVAGAQTVGVNYTNASGCMAAAPATTSVVVQTSPSPVITGSNSECSGTTGIIYNTDPGNFNYVWTISPGGVITTGSGTSQVTVSWLVAGTQTLTVNYTNANGCAAGTPGTRAVTVNPLPVPIITGSSLACMNDTTIYTTEAGMTGYQWTVSSGGTIISGSASDAIEVQWTTSGPKTVSVAYTDLLGCTAATPVIKTVTVQSFSVPSISGNILVCAGSTGIVYTTEQGMTDYTWVVSAGGTITAGSGTSMITVTWNTPGIQFVSVNYANAYGCSAPNPTSLPVTVDTAPVPTITGANQVCVNSGNYTYSTEQGMQNYLWTIPSGGIIVSGQGTRLIQVNWSVAGVHTVNVTYSNTSGCTSLLGSMDVLVKSIPDAHGPISGDTLICKPQSGVVYSIPPIPNALGYVWNVPVSATIVSGANTNMITVDFGAAAQSGNVSVFGTNSCGNGPFSPLLPVGVFPYPETPVITLNPPDTLFSSATSGNQWYREFVLIPGATGQTYIAAHGGRHFVVANPNGCASDTSNIVNVVLVGVEESAVPTVKVYPNPANDRVTLALSTAGREEILSVRLVSNIGQESLILPDFKLQGTVTKVVELGNPPNGIYHLVIRFGDYNVIRKLIVINE